ncbi:MAG: hypothetical protein KKC46_11745 [Proteobacteria bacterium]|nr:hypothetical protein [Pseudomonadota bacterium]
MWHDKLAQAFDKRIDQGQIVNYSIIDIDHNDWIKTVEQFDVVIWKPAYLGAVSASYLKEKIYFIEKHMGKLVIPNFDSIWHFESKIAQSYIFKYHAIPSPKTIVTFDYKNAKELIDQMELPAVLKESFGSSSENVYIVKNRRKLNGIVANIFCQQLWDESRAKLNSIYKTFFRNITNLWAWKKIWQVISGSERFAVSYWQEFVSGNSADLRITVIGDRFAYAFWRKNRPNDFRASGSGLIDYKHDIPEAPLRYCLQMNKRFSFDSMAYDILFTESGNFVVVEMSYGYIDAALYKANGYFELLEKGNLCFHEGHTWPQELWIEWSLIRVNNFYCG